MQKDLVLLGLITDYAIRTGTALLNDETGSKSIDPSYGLEILTGRAVSHPGGKVTLQVVLTRLLTVLVNEFT